jgi:hypothetical protein
MINLPKYLIFLFSGIMLKEVFSFAFCNLFLSFGQVTLLESRDRLGGRIHTDYSFGCPVDMGASW